MVGVVVLLGLVCLQQGCSAIKQVNECRDAFDAGTCYSWFKEGVCADENFKYVAENCLKTCRLCPVISIIDVKDKKKKKMKKKEEVECEDKSSLCLKWRKHCKKGSKFNHIMHKNCRRTCHYCRSDTCIDTTKRCKNFHARGFCQLKSNNHRYMKKHCEKSCGFCLPNTGGNEVEKQFRKYIMEYTCKFEIDECDWSNQVFDDTADWKVGIDPNGPKTGFSNSRKYLYLDATYKGYFAYFVLPWNLVLPMDQMNRGTMCLHFMYQMSDGEIVVAERPTQTAEVKYPADVVIYSTKYITKYWRHEKVNIHVTDHYHLLLKGVKGNPRTYIAIDHIFFSDGECYL